MSGYNLRLAMFLASILMSFDISSLLDLDKYEDIKESASSKLLLALSDCKK